ncbi:hypothetical protein [Actinomadura rupiterrae]|uniref:hypothetical protein n=1 Tax=Actinomadura rupiterrae TaxID=559627 RepID=UPI0020A4A83E|nr:hypothetical protein [Actinomadura rupiterrae]MCP2340193.1 NTP pyrophosphatase (non-canonical NTP hydrolase) [Actinomadura rupiterrae]
MSRPDTDHTTLLIPEPARMFDLGQQIATEMRKHFPVQDERDRQILALAEEAGEFVAAYRRWTGRARRTGPFTDVIDELADVLITAYVTSAVLDSWVPVRRDDIARLLTEEPVRQVMHLHASVGAFVQEQLDNTSTPATGLNRVIAATHATAHALDIDLQAAVDAKTQIVFTRGWRDPR